MEKVLPGMIVQLLINHGVKLTIKESQMISDFIESLVLLSKKIDEQNILLKPVLDFEEASQYLRMSQSHLYKLTSQKQIPHFCPQGKKLYFSREEIDNWLLRNPQSAANDIERAAIDYIIRNKRNK